MSKISKPFTFAPNITIASSQMNADMDTLYNEFNGNISSDNLATKGVTTSKILDANITTAKFQTGAVTSSKINTDAVTAAKIDWAGTGKNSGIWWEELGRTTLGVNADTIDVGSFTGKKYLMVIFFLLPTGGTINGQFRFGHSNGTIDAGNNYSVRSQVNGAADSTVTSAAQISVDSNTAAQTQFGVYEIINIANQEKLVFGRTVGNNANGANAPNRAERNGKWVNTSNLITDVRIINTGTGDFASGSEVVVLGHD